MKRLSLESNFARQKVLKNLEKKSFFFPTFESLGVAKSSFLTSTMTYQALVLGSDSPVSAVDVDGVATLCSVTDLRRLAQQARSVGGIKELRLGKGVDWDSALIRGLAAELRAQPELLRSLERLEVRPEFLDDDADSFACVLRHLPGLRKLTLPAWGVFVTKEFCCDGLARLSNLDELDLEYLKVGDQGALLISQALSKLAKLRKVNLINAFDDDNITCKGLTQVLLSLAVSGSVRVLSVHITGPLAGGGTANALKAMYRSLHKLEICIMSPTPLLSTWTPVLKRLSTCAQLADLCIRYSDTVFDHHDFVDTIAGCVALERLCVQVVGFDVGTYTALLTALVRLPKLHTFEQIGNPTIAGEEPWQRVVRCVRRFADKPGWRELPAIGPVWSRLSPEERVAVKMKKPIGGATYGEYPASKDGPALALERAAAANAKPAKPTRKLRPAPPGFEARLSPAPEEVPPSPSAEPAPAARLPVPRIVVPPKSPRVGDAGVAQAKSPRTDESGAPLSGRAAIAAARAPPVAAASSVPDDVELAGNWKLREKKSIVAAAPLLEEARASVRAILGDMWTLSIDWAAFDAATADFEGEREPGDCVIKRIVAKFVEKDLQVFESDIIDALNALCMAQHIKVTCTTRHDGKERVHVSASPIAVEIVWNAAWYSSQYNEPYLHTWALNSC
jgi:hypothetical protein